MVPADTYSYPRDALGLADGVRRQAGRGRGGHGVLRYEHRVESAADLEQ